MIRTAAFTLFAGLLVGCTTVAPIQRPAGEPQEYVVACGSGSGWNICYNKANKICPQGYKTTRERGGFNRKELWIRC